jgi:hypothetical protein
MLHPPAEDNFCDEYGNVPKPATVQDYDRHMEYTVKSDCMTNSYSIRKCIWKWIKKIVLSPSGPFKSKQLYSHLILWFRLALVRDLLQQ